MHVPARQGQQRLTRHQLAVLAFHRANVVDRHGVVGIVGGLAGDIDDTHRHDETSGGDLIHRGAALHEVRRGVKVRASVLMDIDAARVVPVGRHVGLFLDAQRRLAGPWRRGGRQGLGEVNDTH